MATVLVCIDASEYSEAALDWYISKIRKPEDTLTLLHCPEEYFKYDFLMSPKVVQDCNDNLKKETKKIEEKYKKKMEEKGVAYTWKLEHSMKPGEKICDVAKQLKPDYIVLGTRGMGTVRRTILGSISDYVVHHAHCPVLTCHKSK